MRFIIMMLNSGSLKLGYVIRIRVILNLDRMPWMKISFAV